MKFINKKPGNPRIKNTIILIIILIICTAAGGTALYFLHDSRELDLSFAYNVDEELYGTHGAEAQMRKAPSFASTLCVSSQNVGLEGVSLSGNVMGALFDLDNDETVFAQGIHERAYPASITKIMTGILAVKYGNMEDMITISENCLNLEEGSTEVGFQSGDQVTLDDLFHALLIYSGNDAAMAISEHIGGSVDSFVAMMNEEALAIGATNTHFVNPTGLHNENHYTSVYDIYLMLREAMNYPHFMEVMQLSSYNITCYRGEEKIVTRLDSTDQYLTRQVTAPRDVTVLGGKTGTTSDAGSCLALLSQNAYGEPFISIVLHASTKAALYDSMNQLLSKINS